MLNLMKKYTAPFSVTGNEHKLAEIIKSDIAPYVDSVTEDAMGNLIAFKKEKTARSAQCLPPTWMKSDSS